MGTMSFVAVGRCEPDEEDENEDEDEEGEEEEVELDLGSHILCHPILMKKEEVSSPS